MTPADRLPVAAQVLGVLLVMLAGAAAVWLGWLDRHADRSLASLIANLFFPAYFISKLAVREPMGTQAEIWLPPLFGFVETCLGFGIAWLVIRTIGPLFGLTSPIVQRTFALTVGIANYGYVPLPLAEQFFPQAFAPTLVHNIGVDVALWSVGLLVISGEAASGLRRLMTSLPLWTMLLSLAIQQLQLGPWIPRPLLLTCELLGSCAIPAGLLLSGAIIAEAIPSMHWRQKKSVLGLAVGVRMLLLPALFLVAARHLPMSPALDQVLLLQASMPAASFPIVMTRLYGGDIDTATRVVFGTSALSLLTIPLWITAGSWYLGLG